MNIDYDLDHLSDVMAHKISGRGCGKSVADAFAIAYDVDVTKNRYLIVCGDNMLVIDHFIEILIDVFCFMRIAIERTKRYEMLIKECDVKIIFMTKSETYRLYRGYEADIYMLHFLSSDFFEGVFADRHSFFI